jgi:adenylyl-sulfate kinase
VAAHRRGEPASHDIVSHDGFVGPARRATLLGQRPATIWLTGLSGSGKSTLAYRLEEKLAGLGRASYVLDGDNIRQGLSRDLGFGPEERRENIRRVAEVSALMNDAGLVVITAFISPYGEDRAMARDIIGASRFVEVFLDASLDACERRDPRGLYRRARNGEIPGFTGIGAPYEPPESPELVIATGEVTIEDALERLLQRALRAVES